ncbi:SFRICE_006345, partial [Gryllus bimaculatus]
MSWGDARARPRLAALLLVVARAARLLREGTCITRRELFYAHAHDLRDQSAIDVAVLDAAAILEVPPWELRILPTSKGLIAGPIVLHMASGATIDCDVPG